MDSKYLQQEILLLIEFNGRVFLIDSKTSFHRGIRQLHHRKQNQMCRFQYREQGLLL